MGLLNGLAKAKEQVQFLHPDLGEIPSSSEDEPDAIMEEVGDREDVSKD